MAGLRDDALVSHVILLALVYRRPMLSSHGPFLRGWHEVLEFCRVFWSIQEELLTHRH